MLHFYHQRANNVWAVLGRNEPSWENLAVSLQSKGSAIILSLTAAILTVLTSQNPNLTYLSFNSFTRLWSFYVSHLRIEAGCVVVSDAILYHHRDNPDVLFPYCDSYLRTVSSWIQTKDSFCLFLPLSLLHMHAYIISLIQPFQMKNELFFKTYAERIR